MDGALTCKSGKTCHSAMCKLVIFFFLIALFQVGVEDITEEVFRKGILMI